MTSAVVLAAGRGARLGGVAKALLVDSGAPATSFLARIAATSAAAGIGAGAIVVVVGPPHEEAVAGEARRLGLAVARNPAPDRGMASSVAVGFAALSSSPSASSASVALLWPVDHPAVAPTTVRSLLDRAGGDRWTEPTHGGRGGHPAAIGRALWPALAACGETLGGARAVRDADPSRIVRVAVDDPGVVRDVDLPAARA